MPGDLTGELISDYYTSLLHLSGSNVKEAYNNDSYSDIAINPIFDGAGNSTGIKLSAGPDPGSEDLSTEVIVSNFIAPSANPYVGYSELPNSSSMVLSPVAQAQRQLGIVGNDAVIYRDWLDTFYPIGSIQMTCYDDNPGNRIAGTKWVLISQGQYPVGVGTGTDSNNNSVTFSKENDQTADGDRLGEYGNQLQSRQLPSHGHNLNTQTTDVPGADASSINRLPYFGADPNPAGTENEDGEFNGQNFINRFQTNEAGFRDTQIKGRNIAGYKYTDDDFNPELGGFSLKGWSWGSPSNESAGANVGEGWGGIVEDTTATRPVYEASNFDLANELIDWVNTSDAHWSDSTKSDYMPRRRAKNFLVSGYWYTEKGHINRDKIPRDPAEQWKGRFTEYESPPGAIQTGFGSAADYSAARREHLLELGYKEVQGIWNGQTRFLDTKIKQNGMSIYDKAKALGRVKVLMVLI